MNSQLIAMIKLCNQILDNEDSYQADYIYLVQDFLEKTEVEQNSICGFCSSTCSRVDCPNRSTFKNYPIFRCAYVDGFGCVYPCMIDWVTLFYVRDAFSSFSAPSSELDESLYCLIGGAY